MSSALKCEAIEAAFAAASGCEETADGLRFVTQCLYPSFDPVAVYLVRVGTDTVIHDGAGATRSALLHGRDKGALTRALKRQANLHHLTLENESLSVRVEADEWIPSGILAVANASAAAAFSAAEAVQQSMSDALHEAIKQVLTRLAGAKNVGTSYSMRGRSGKKHTFDFAVTQRDGLALVDAVSPHHVSISSRYVAFSDTQDVEGVRGKFAVYDKPLDEEDIALLGQFADVVPFKVMPLAFDKYFKNGPENSRPL